MSAGVIGCRPIYQKIKSRRKFKRNCGGFLWFWRISQSEDAKSADSRCLIIRQFCDGQAEKMRFYTIFADDQIMR